MESMVLVIIVGLLNLLSFYFGAKLANNKDEFSLNPIELHERHIERLEEQEIQKEYAKREKEMQINFENIDNYDGSDLGQKNFD